MMHKKYFKKESRESNKKKRMLKRNTNKREKLSKIWKNRSNKFNLKMKEKMLSSWKSMRILRSSNESLSRTSNQIMPNSLSKLKSLMRHFQRVNLESEKKLSSGKSSTMKLKECTQISKQNLKRTKLSGLANLTSQRNRKSNIRKIMRISRLCSNKLSINFKETAKTQK